MVSRAYRRWTLIRGNHLASIDTLARVPGFPLILAIHLPVAIRKELPHWELIRQLRQRFLLLVMNHLAHHSAI